MGRASRCTSIGWWADVGDEPTLMGRVVAVLRG
jgi:hypothetical protein